MSDKDKLFDYLLLRLGKERLARFALIGLKQDETCTEYVFGDRECIDDCEKCWKNELKKWGADGEH